PWRGARRPRRGTGSDAGEGSCLLDDAGEVARACGAALLRMELAADERAAPRLGHDPFRPGGRARRRGGERVRKVEVAEPVDACPAHARDASLTQPLRASGQET